MKKIFLSLLSGMLLFSGCSFGGDDSEKLSNEVEEKAKNSPEELFFQLAQANLDYLVTDFKENFPSKELLTKNGSETSISGELNTTEIEEGLPIKKIIFSLNAEGKTDKTNTEDVKVSQNLNIVVEALHTEGNVDQYGKLDASLAFKIVDNSFLASVQKAIITGPDQIVAKTEAIFSLFTEKWYGNTFDELNALAGGQVDIKKLITGKGMGVILWEILEDEQANLKNYMTFVSFKETKDGVSYFEVKMNAEKSKENLEKLLDGFGFSDEAMVQAVAEFEKSINAVRDEIFVLGLKASDPSYISAKMAATDMNSGEKIEGKENTIVYSSDEISGEFFPTKDNVLRIEAKDGKFSIGGDNKEEKNFVFVTGTYSDTEFVFVAEDTEIEKTDNKISGSFTKSGKTWAGEITNTIDDSIVVKIANAFFEKDSVSASIVVEKTGEAGVVQIGNISITSSLSDIETFVVEKPETVVPFVSIMQMMGAFSQIGSGGNTEPVIINDSEMINSATDTEIKKEMGEIAE